MVSKYDKGVDWQEVALNMQNGRTTFSCFRRFQQKNVEGQQLKWTDQENKLLISLVDSCKTPNINDIQWEEIRKNFPGRTKRQVCGYV